MKIYYTIEWSDLDFTAQMSIEESIKEQIKENLTIAQLESFKDELDLENFLIKECESRVKEFRGVRIEL